jgi:hypothetical protein
MNALEWFGAFHLLVDAAVLTVVALACSTARRDAGRGTMTREDVAAIRARIRANRTGSVVPDDGDEHATNLGAV